MYRRLIALFVLWAMIWACCAQAESALPENTVPESWQGKWLVKHNISNGSTIEMPAGTFSLGIADSTITSYEGSKEVMTCPCIFQNGVIQCNDGSVDITLELLADDLMIATVSLPDEHLALILVRAEVNPAFLGDWTVLESWSNGLGLLPPEELSGCHAVFTADKVTLSNSQGSSIVRLCVYVDDRCDMNDGEFTATINAAGIMILREQSGNVTLLVRTPE